MYTASARAAAGTATLPFGAVYAAASSNGTIREIKVFTEAANAAVIRIVRVTTAGTWTAITENEMNEDRIGPSCTGVHTASGTAPTIQTGDIDVGMVAAQIGSGFVYTYYGEQGGIEIPTGTGNGVALIEAADTANTYSFTILWEE
jgi:hypothetical protein